MLLIELTPDTSIYQLTEALNCIKEDGETAHLIVAGEGLIEDVVKLMDTHDKLNKEINEAIEKAFGGASGGVGEVKIGEIHPDAVDGDEYFESRKDEIRQKMDNGEITPAQGIDELWKLAEQSLEVRFAHLRGYIDGLFQ